MSIVLGSIAAEAGRGPESILTGHAGFAVAAFTAGAARDAKQGVTRNPLEDEPAHGLVHGPKTHSNRKKLVKASTWAVPPPGQGA